MIALEAKYHRKCYIDLYTLHRALVGQQNEENGSGTLHGIAFAELVTYIRDVCTEEEGLVPIF